MKKLFCLAFALFATSYVLIADPSISVPDTGIVFGGGGSGSTELDVTGGGVVYLSGTNSVQMTVSNLGTGDLNYRASITKGDSWLSIREAGNDGTASGTIKGAGSVVYNLDVDRTALGLQYGRAKVIFTGTYGEDISGYLVGKKACLSDEYIDARVLKGTKVKLIPKGKSLVFNGMVTGIALKITVVPQSGKFTVKYIGNNTVTLVTGE